MRRLIASIVIAASLVSGAASALPPDLTAVRGVVNGSYYAYNIPGACYPGGDGAYGAFRLTGQFNFGGVWRGIVHTSVERLCLSNVTLGPWRPRPPTGTSLTGSSSVFGSCLPTSLTTPFVVTAGYLEATLACSGHVTTSAGSKAWKATLAMEALIVAGPCAVLTCGGSFGPSVWGDVVGVFFKG